MRRLMGALAMVTALGVTAACGSSGGSGGSGGNGSGKEPLRILLIAPESAAILGKNALTSINAAKAAVDTINAAGGVLGRPLELTVVDDGANPTTAISKLESALNGSDKPAVVLQTDASGVAEAMLPLTSQAKVVTFNQSPTATSGDPTKFPYNFDLSPSTATYASAFCPQMQKMGAKTFGIIYNDDPFAEAETSDVASQCRAAGLTLVGSEKFAPTAIDVTPQLAALQAKKPDVLMVSTYGAPSGYVLQGLDRLGWKVPVLGDDAFMVSPVITTPAPGGMLGTAAEANAKALVFASTAYSASEPAAVTNMISGMKKYGAIPAPLIVAYGYDEVVLAAAGAQAAGTTTDGPAIAKAIAALPPGGPKTAIFPAYHFTSTSHAANVAASTFTFVAPSKVIDGQFGAPGSS